MVLSSDVVENIRSIASPLIAQGSQVEIEARLGTFSGKDFQSGVSRQTFNRIRELGMKLAGLKYSYLRTEDRIFYEGPRNIRERYTTEYDVNRLPTNKYHLIKTTVNNIDFGDHFLRISISKEDIDSKLPPETEPIFVRDKRRWSFPIANNQFRLDLTEITSYRPRTRDPKSAQTVYEIEIEILSPVLTNLDFFGPVLEAILSEILNTHLLYTQSEKTAIISRINNYLGSTINNIGEINSFILSQARNIKARDLVHGGIVPKTDHGVFYTVSPKADGFRKMLVFDPNGIYLVSTPNVVNKIFDIEVAQKLETWEGTIIEGELVPAENLESYAPQEYRSLKYYFLMYDVLSVSGDYTIRQKHHSERLKYIEVVERLFSKIPEIRFVQKPFREFQTRSGFYENVNVTLNENWPFKTDGLVFTPSNYQYDTDLFGTKTISERSLNKYPDIVKWKPLELLTIDFEIEHKAAPDGNYIDLLSSKKSFRGTRRFPFDPKKNVNQSQLIKEAPSGTIVEFRWDSINKFFVPIRIREDKDKANSIKVAIDVWEDIHRPITEPVIRGDKFGLVFRYHNRIKESLFIEVGRSLPRVDGTNIKSRTLLDIGSGKGGDVNKWVKAGFTHVICVEPNEDNRIELTQRLGKTSLKYDIVPVNGQDVEIIYDRIQKFAPNKSVDTISYMLSLSFFFDQPDSILSIFHLINLTLMFGGYFVGFTIDGRSVLEFFNNPKLFTMDNNVKIANFRMVDFRLHPPSPEHPYNHIFIHIPDSIVENQYESLTNLPELFKYSEQNLDTKLIKEERANEEKFMTSEELIYTQLFTSFIMKKILPPQ